MFMLLSNILLSRNVHSEMSTKCANCIWVYWNILEFMDFHTPPPLEFPVTCSLGVTEKQWIQLLAQWYFKMQQALLQSTAVFDPWKSRIQTVIFRMPAVCCTMIPYAIQLLDCVTSRSIDTSPVREDPDILARDCSNPQFCKRDELSVLQSHFFHCFPYKLKFPKLLTKRGSLALWTPPLHPSLLGAVFKAWLKVSSG